MNKGLTITLIVLLSILLIGIVGIMIFLFNGNYDFTSFSLGFGESKTLVDEKEIINIKKLNIEANRADVSVETKEENTNIKVELYSDYVDEYEITEKDDEIKVVLKDNIIGFSTKGSRVKIYVPTTYDKDIKVVNKTGDINIGKLSNSNLNIKLTTGDIKVREGKDIVASLTTGDVEIGEANNANVTGTTGDIDVDNAKTVKVKLVTGDITLGDINGSLDLTLTTGDIKVDEANLTKNSIIKSGTGDVKIRKTTNCYVEATTKVGDTRVNNNDRKSDNVLTITSRVGDIRVN